VAGAIEEQVDGGTLPSATRLAGLVAAGHHVRVTSPQGDTVEAGPPPGREVREASAAIGRVRVVVAEPADDAEGRVHNLWLIVGVAGAGGLVLAAVLAAWQARRLARPLEDLADVSRRLGRGDLGARAGPQEIPEMDTVARALDHSAGEIGRLMERERAFSSNVAHQIRSPLTALDMRLEELAGHPDPAVRHEATAALEQSERLRRTTDDLLDLARHGRAGALDDLDIDHLVDDRIAAWQPAVAAGRRLARQGPPSGTPARAPRAAVEQAVDVLVENALRHGRGDIGIATDARGRAVHIVVADEGALAGDDAGSRVFLPRDGAGGIGLSLARALLETGGGRLSLASSQPTRFEIVLPTGNPDLPSPDGGSPPAPHAESTDRGGAGGRPPRATSSGPPTSAPGGGYETAPEEAHRG